MSQLQIGLISLGALIILGVLLFNWWQERNIRREMYRRFEGPVDDALMKGLRSSPRNEGEDFRIDAEAVPDAQEDSPTVGEVTAPSHAVVSPDAAPAAEEMQEPSLSSVGAAPSRVPTSPDFPMAAESERGAESSPIEEHTDAFVAQSIRLSDPEPDTPSVSQLPPSVDLQIDEIALLVLQHPCSGLAIRDALQPLPAFSKSMRWLGRDADGAWHLLTRDQEDGYFDRVICALQLADRSGPASGEDLRNLHFKVEDLAERIGGRVEWMEHADPLQYARDLDQFCMGVDVMVSLKLVAESGGPFAGTKLRGLAEASGMTLKEDGRFCFLGETGEPLFTLACLDQRELTPEVLRTVLLRGVVLTMDVPRVANGIEVFNQMVQLGRKLESALASRLMDENQQPLGDKEIEKIRQQLRIIYSSMLARGIVPGSATALRLFS
jgi:FtsZ-interacting cell division protein ZipA